MKRAFKKFFFIVLICFCSSQLGAVFPSGDICSYLETFLLVTFVKAKDASKHPAGHRKAPTTKSSPAQMLIVPRLRNSGIFMQDKCVLSKSIKERGCCNHR